MLRHLQVGHARNVARVRGDHDARLYGREAGCRCGNKQRHEKSANSGTDYVYRGTQHTAAVADIICHPEDGSKRRCFAVESGESELPVRDDETLLPDKFERPVHLTNLQRRTKAERHARFAQQAC